MPESHLDMRLNSTGFTYLKGPLHKYIYGAKKPTRVFYKVNFYNQISNRKEREIKKMCTWKEKNQLAQFELDFF